MAGYTVALANENIQIQLLPTRGTEHQEGTGTPT